MEIPWGMKPGPLFCRLANNNEVVEHLIVN